MRVQRLLYLIVICLLIVQPMAAQVFDVETIQPEELEPGMTGYGLTVFQGHEPERFGVEILGVLRKNWAGEDMILARLDHPVIDDLGVVSGMSGSPVYIEDKLIGAVAYGWAFNKRPICGITPIHLMEEVFEEITLEPQIPETEWVAALESWPEARQALNLPEIETPNINPQALQSLGLPAGQSEGLRRLATPLYISSAHSAVVKKAAEIFGPSFHPMQGTGGSGYFNPSRYADSSFEPGSAIASDLITGDLSISAVGTVTYVMDDQFVAYGHPGFGMGPTDMAVSLAEIITVMPSAMMPFKLGYPVKELGAMRQDRLFAVGGTLQARSPKTDLRFRVRSDVLAEEETFEYQIWKQREFFPSLVLICVLESASMLSSPSGMMTVEADYTMTLSDGRTIQRRHFESGSPGAYFNTAINLAITANQIMNNRFEPADIVSIDGVITIEESRQLMVLDKIIRKKTEVYPGGNIEGVAEYTRFREKPIRVPFSIAVPEDLKPGQYELQIIDSAARTQIEIAANPELARVDSFDELIEQQQPDFADNRIYFLLAAPQERLVIGESRLEELPGSIAAVTRATMRDPQLSYEANGRILSETSRRFDSRVAGSQYLTITVKEPDE